MTVPEVVSLRLAGDPALPLLVCGPSLGTSATALWSGVADRLGDAFHVVGWDLPGHGRNRTTAEPFTVADLAAAVMGLVDRVLAERGPRERGGRFCYAGNSLGGAVGLQLLLDAPGRLRSAVLLCTGARIGKPDGWHERVATVRSLGMASMVEGAVGRWFAPGFVDRHPQVAEPLLSALRECDEAGYAAACEALAEFDVRDRLGEITVPVLAVAGAHDEVTTDAVLRVVADGVAAGRLVVLPDVAHLAPAEAPDEVARLVREHADGRPPAEGTR